MKIIKDILLLPALLIKSVMIGAIRLYKIFICPLLPPACRFTPTCSQYFTEALQKKGIVVGTIMGTYRILRCNPFCEGGHDPVDPREKKPNKTEADFTRVENNPYLKENLDLDSSSSPPKTNKSRDEN